jgi:Gluconate 2-dehydrogenase subunit 3
MNFTRRGFIEAGVLVSIGVSAARAIGTSQEQGRPTAALDLPERDVLRIVMDEIIPAGDGMPAASEVGSADYLARLMGGNSQIAERIRGSVAVLEGLSRDHFQSSFGLLQHDDRLTLLTMFERQDAASFSSLRDFVYEAYYLQPRVWELLGYQCFTTNRVGPQMNAFDEKVLGKVQKMPRNYREV